MRGPELVKTMSVQPPRGAGRVRLLQHSRHRPAAVRRHACREHRRDRRHPRAEDPQRRAAQPARGDRAGRLKPGVLKSGSGNWGRRCISDSDFRLTSEPHFGNTSPTPISISDPDFSHPDFQPSRSLNSSRIGRWPATILRRASSSVNQAARSISGNACIRPERGGHSSANVLLLMLAASKSASAANACTVLPRDCVTGVSGVTSVRSVDARLLEKLAARGRGRCFARIELPFRDRPRAVVPARPERAARMDEQHLERRAAASIQDDSRALRPCHRSRFASIRRAYHSANGEAK